MVLDDHAFVRLIAEGKVSLVTLTAVGGDLKYSAGARVTKDNSFVGLRVVRGPNWVPQASWGNSDGRPGNTGVLVKPAMADKSAWYVQWDPPGKYDEYCTGNWSLYRLSVAVPTEFKLEDVCQPPVVEVTLVGSRSKYSFELMGNAQERITKLVAWLPQHGLALSGGKPTDTTRKQQGTPEKVVRTWTFTRADLPF